MAANESEQPITSFLGTGWSFPPEFVRETGTVRMTSDEDDIDASLRILFQTARGERLFQPEYGLDMQELVFQPLSATLKTLLAERINVAILIHEPRIEVLSLHVHSPNPHDGSLLIFLEYRIIATNSRFNLVFPFYSSDANEARASLGL